MPNQGLLSVPEAAEVMEMSTATIYKCVRSGAPAHRWGAAGRYFKVNPDELREWMEAQRYEGRESREGTLIPRSKLEDMAQRRRARVQAR